MNCRHCHTVLTDVFIDMGTQPPSNSFLSKEELNSTEALYPLKTFICSNCFLVQIDEHKKKEDIFNQGYVYFSSYSSSWVEHAHRYTEMIIERFNLNYNSKVVEIASNDGYLLQHIKSKGIPCYGIEPSLATAYAAFEKGIESIHDFFGEKLAIQLLQKRGPVDLLIGNNVLAHVPDINDFVKGVKIFLKSDGVATFEFPHLMSLVDECQFDTIYHEHFSYLSFGTVNKIFSSFGLTIFDVEKLKTHGGSLRIFVCHNNTVFSQSNSVKKLLDDEKNKGMYSLEYYSTVSKNAARIKNELLGFLQEQKKEDKLVVAYGAAAKGNTLLNFCGINHTLINFCVDASPHKQKLFLPGSHIPILHPKTIKKEKPDYVLILPWNLKDEIMIEHSYITDWGGRFITALPNLHLY